MVLWEIITLGATPYPACMLELHACVPMFIDDVAVSDGEVKQHIMDEARLPKPSHVHPALYSVCMQCWNQSPQARLSMDALITSIAALMTDRDAMTGLPGLPVCASVSLLTH